MSLGPSPWPDCGTTTAATRHYRRKEPACTACRQAEARYKADRRNTAGDGAQTIDRRPIRNGLSFIPYVWRGRRYPWAQRVLAATLGPAAVPSLADYRQVQRQYEQEAG